MLGIRKPYAVAVSSGDLTPLDVKRCLYVTNIADAAVKHHGVGGHELTVGVVACFYMAHIGT